MTPLVRLPCLHHGRRLTFPWGSHRWPLLAVRPPLEQRLVVRPHPRRSDHSQNSGWWTHHHPRQSDHMSLCYNIVACFTDFGRATRCAHNFGCAPHNTHDSDHATRGPDINDFSPVSCGTHDSDLTTCSPDVHDSGCTTHVPDVLVLPAAILMSPSSCAGATSTASTSVLPTDEGRTSVGPVNPHLITTWVKRGFWLPADTLTQSSTSASALSPMPSSICVTLIDLNLCHAMEEEFVDLIANNTWDLVPHPVGSNVITSRWIFKHRFNSDGSLERYKAR
jgi:hypothetical protein